MADDVGFTAVREAHAEGYETSRAHGQAVGQQWKDTEFNQAIQAQILETVSYLNNFDHQMKLRLSEINRRLNNMQKTIAFLECAVKP